MRNKDCIRCRTKLSVNTKLSGYTISIKPTQMANNRWHRSIMHVTFAHVQYRDVLTSNCAGCYVYKHMLYALYALYLNKLGVNFDG